MWIPLFLAILLHQTQGQEVTIESLENGPGLLPFKLGPAKIISHYHSFLYYINLDSLRLQLELVQNQISDLKPKLCNKTLSLFDPHLDHLTNKLSQLYSQLQILTLHRNKRGLIDGLGSIIKSISGNLDYTDAIKYENAIELLQNDNQKLETEINTRISLNKDWISQTSKIIENIVANQEIINKSINSLIQKDIKMEAEFVEYAHLAQHLFVLSDNIEDLSEELSNLQNTLSFIRASSTTYSIFSFKDIKSMLVKLRTLYLKDEVLDIDYRNFYEVIKLGYFYLEDQIVIVIKVPIAIPNTYDLYKLAVVPNKNHRVLIPTSPYLAISGKDSRYMEAECPKINTWFLCKSQLSYKGEDRLDCVESLIIHQQLNQSCALTPVILKNEALEQLDDKHYTLSFPLATKIHISCGQEQYKTLQGSYVVVIPLGCFVKTPGFTIRNTNDRIKGHIVKILEIPQDIELEHTGQPIITLTSTDLNAFHSINTKMSMQPPVHLNQIKDTAILYHTTIPLYAILLIATTITIIIIYRRLRARTAVKHEVKDHPTDIEVPETPRRIKVDPRHISSASLSHKVLE